MSLKGFHIVFVSVCILLALAVSVWGLRDYRTSGQVSSLALGVGAMVIAPVMIGYGMWFLKKMRKITLV